MEYLYILFEWHEDLSMYDLIGIFHDYEMAEKVAKAVTTGDYWIYTMELDDEIELPSYEDLTTY